MIIDPVLLQQVINGLSLGAMYALLALGFTLVYGILELINFAHFNVFMVSSFIGMWALEMLGISGQSTVLGGFALVGTLVFAFVVTMLSAGVLGVAIERIALRPLRNAGGAARLHCGRLGRHRQRHRRDGRGRSDRAHREPRRPFLRDALGRCDHFLDPCAGAGLCAERAVRPRPGDARLILTR